MLLTTQTPKKAPKKRHKYGAKKVVIDGHKFDSKKEGSRYVDLKMMQLAGHITDLKLQPRFALHAVTPNMEWVQLGYYISDFDYMEEGERIIEDVKGMKTATYRWKKKHFEAQYDMKIRET